ncbi:hypothetical protein I79_011806 [Cricetulus griseus]|uniref:Uncharacterized protein n=1 Tax=Cricetulus griseus TaxID=10029 RepID=G3HM58_CRIGR|nr:hypothetical protein I79_011806 [Cricetulus griseus]
MVWILVKVSLPSSGFWLPLQLQLGGDSEPKQLLRQWRGAQWPLLVNLIYAKGPGHLGLA